jgi:lipopolysaccharide transport system permease protein
MDNKKEWTELISAKRHLLDINLKELWQYRDLIFLFVRRDFISTYKQTILGPIWLFLQPLLTTLTFYIIFTQIAQISTNTIDPILFYLSGITLWNYFSDCLNKTSNTFIANASIFGKVYFPRLTTPISIVLSNLIKLGIQLVLLFAVAAYRVIFYGITIEANWALLVFPIQIFILAIMGLGLGIIFSSLTTKYRDLSFLLTFAVQLLMYATPVIYPLNFTSGKLHLLISYNPLTPIMENFRYALFNVGAFDLKGLIYSGIFSLITLAFGIILFNKVEKSFMDTV